MLSVPELDLLILQLFDVTASTAWSAWLGAAAKVFRSDVAGVSPLGTPSNWPGGVVVGSSAERRDAYRNYYYRVDLWMQRMRAAPAGTPQSLDMLVPDGELYKSEYYNDFMRPVGRRYRAGVTMEVNGSKYILAFGRSQDDGNYDGDDMAAIGRISTFVRRSLQTQRLLLGAEASSHAAHQVLNQTRGGILLLDRDFRVSFANKMAADHLGAEDIVGIRGNQPVALNRSDEGKLRAALEASIANPGRQTIIMLRGTKSEAHVTASIMGLPSSGPPLLDLGVAPPAILVVLTNHAEQNEVQPQTLESVFGLTAQEARTASLLIAGMDLNGVASALSIGRETVRYHLKGLFAKTGTHSQRELVHFITGSLPPLPAGIGLGPEHG